MLRGIVLALSLIGLIACSSPSATHKPVETTTGGYMAGQDYVVKGGVLYAWNGVEWFYLRSPEIQAGSVGGTSVAQPECWLRVDGGLMRCFQRTPQTFRDQSLRPVFVGY